MRIIDVETSKKYKIFIERGLLADFGERLCRTVFANGQPNLAKLLFAADKNTARYRDMVMQSAEKYGFICYSYDLPDGENAKTLDSVADLIKFMLDRGFVRGDAVIAVGGGAVGDCAGFAASIYHRGTKFVNVPTTLSAMTDSAIGGKTAIDFGGIKNTVGTFYQPDAVFSDVDCLLSTDITASAGELVKYAMLSKSVYDKLARKKLMPTDFEDVVCECALFKASVVAKDEFDCGYRHILNLGHTLAHATEVLSGFRVSHSDAVLRGVYEIALCSDAAYGVRNSEKVAALAKMQGVKIIGGFPKSELKKIVAKDKKWRNEKLSAVIIKAVGRCETKEFSADEFNRFLDGGLE